MAGFLSNGTMVVPIGKYNETERELLHLLFINGELTETDYRKYLEDCRNANRRTKE